MSPSFEPILNGAIPIRVNECDRSVLVHVPGGEFLMGSEEGFDAERPVHRVHVDAFELGRDPVTNLQYRRFVGETGHRIPHLRDARAQAFNWDPATASFPAGREDHPVVLVSWDDASAYCEWAGGRLPTEAEWERAARAGVEGRRYPWGDEADAAYANFDSRSGTTPVGSYPANAYGLRDMAGNVWEWVGDRFDPDYYRSAVVRNPRGPDEGATRVLRGGAWLLFPDFCRVSYRFRQSHDFRSELIGFRLARSLP
jgi:formylglycine-generating enzyme required for sulfatase activity